MIGQRDPAQVLPPVAEPGAEAKPEQRQQRAQ